MQNYPQDFTPGHGDLHFTPSSTIWIENEIIFIYSHPNILHSIEDAKTSNKILDEYIPSKSFPMICDVRDAKPLSKAVRNYYASAEGTRHCTKFAFIVASSFSKVVANFFIGFSNIDYPIKMFDDVQKAIDWCSK